MRKQYLRGQIVNTLITAESTCQVVKALIAQLTNPSSLPIPKASLSSEQVSHKQRQQRHKDA